MSQKFKCVIFINTNFRACDISLICGSEELLKINTICLSGKSSRISITYNSKPYVLDLVKSDYKGDFDEQICPKISVKDAVTVHSNSKK